MFLTKTQRMYLEICAEIIKSPTKQYADIATDYGCSRQAVNNAVLFGKKYHVFEISHSEKLREMKIALTQIWLQLKEDWNRAHIIAGKSFKAWELARKELDEFIEDPEKAMGASFDGQYGKRSLYRRTLYNLRATVVQEVKMAQVSPGRSKALQTGLSEVMNQLAVFEGIIRQASFSFDNPDDMPTSFDITYVKQEDITDVTEKDVAEVRKITDVSPDK